MRSVTGSLLCRNIKQVTYKKITTMLLYSSKFNYCYDSKHSHLGANLPDIWHSPPPPPPPPSNNHTTHSDGHSAAIIDGKSIAKDIKFRIANEILEMKAATGKCPGLAIVLVGERRDSETFVRIKLKACEEVGIAYFVAELPNDCTENDIIDVVSNFNKNSLVHGIIVQLPLPQHLNEEKILNSLSPEKDVDGFHPLNMGNLALRGREPLFVPCAAKSCVELLLRFGVEIMRKKAVVVGRGKIVGLPTSLLLQRNHATVSTVHAFTENPELITCEADIVVTDVGVPNLVRGDWLKPGAFVIDTGANLVKDEGSRYGRRIVGDVCFEEASQLVSVITPVPGGVGPVTISMLLSNTLQSAKRMLRFNCN